eukprot:1157418-Pelagomonas_calceolata.AAC.13
MERSRSKAMLLPASTCTPIQCMPTTSKRIGNVSGVPQNISAVSLEVNSSNLQQLEFLCAAHLLQF